MLDDFLQWYETAQNFYGYPLIYTERVAVDYKTIFAGGNGSGALIRASNLGDPLVVLILKKLGYSLPHSTLSPKVKNFLYTGYEVEARLISMLHGHGLYTVDRFQEEVEYRGYKGHIDLVLNDSVVIDIKAVKNASFNRMFSKRPYISDRYKAQLAFYRAALELPHSGLLVYNRDTSDIGYIDLSNDEEAKTELDRKLDELKNEWSLDAVWEHEEELIIEPKPEIYKGTETGNYLLPDEMRFTGYASVFYHLAEGVNGYGREQIYVLGYKTLEEAKQELDTWQEKSLLSLDEVEPEKTPQLDI